jgi:hypothetical protein
MQTDGLTLYDSSDASQVGKNLSLTLYAPFTELVAMDTMLPVSELEQLLQFHQSLFSEVVSKQAPNGAT